MTNFELEAIRERLRRYGQARNRHADRESRYITITDDEALVLLDALDLLDAMKEDR